MRFGAGALHAMHLPYRPRSSVRRRRCVKCDGSRYRDCGVAPARCLLTGRLLPCRPLVEAAYGPAGVPAGRGGLGAAGPRLTEGHAVDVCANHGTPLRQSPSCGSRSRCSRAVPLTLVSPACGNPAQIARTCSHRVIQDAPARTATQRRIRRSAIRRHIS